MLKLTKRHFDRKHLRSVARTFLRPGADVRLLDYKMNSRSRYGFGMPAHSRIKERLERNMHAYIDLLGSMEALAGAMRRIGANQPSDAFEPYWLNGYVQGLDAISLYAMPALLKPSRYMEIGSGNSTKFVARSRHDNGLDFSITSIDPHPRAAIDDLCSRVIRSGLEDADLSIFESLKENDIVVFDGSHYVLPNSDVVVFFLEVLPMLARGVYVYIDDIWWPLDYPPDHAARHYSEQYMAGVLLLSQDPRYEVVLPTTLADFDEGLKQVRDRLFTACFAEPEAAAKSCGLWLRIAG